MENNAFKHDENYERKWRYLSAYRDRKVHLIYLCEKRDELRDLKRISDDLGLPPTSGVVGDPTGNTAVRLVDDIGKTTAEINKAYDSLTDITNYIDGCKSEHDKMVLIMKFIRGKTVDEIAYSITEKTGRMASRSSVKKRLYRIVNDLPDIK